METQEMRNDWQDRGGKLRRILKWFQNEIVRAMERDNLGDAQLAAAGAASAAKALGEAERMIEFHQPLRVKGGLAAYMRAVGYEPVYADTPDEPGTHGLHIGWTTKVSHETKE